MLESKPQTLRVLHLDDDPFELSKVEKALNRNSIHCHFVTKSVSRINEFRDQLEQEPNYDVVILDIHIEDPDHPEYTGITLSNEVRVKYPNSVILMRSTSDEVSTIAECLNVGADDFISKKSDKGELSLRVYNSYKLAALKRGFDVPLKDDVLRISKTKDVHYAGDTLCRIAKRLPAIINSAISSVHVVGESGTGKEVVADLFSSEMKEGTPFIKVNCGAIVPTLIESELFGHIKGAFTGALTDKKGYIERATGGWIFLDEIATLSLSSQVALLRVIENQEVVKVGSSTPTPVKVRVISASNENLEDLVKEGRFRQDLWQRLCETEIKLPPLRERADEIEELVKHFCKTMQGGPYEITESVLDVLTKLSWKSGNVRELRNCLRAMTEFHVDKLLTPLSIPERIWNQVGHEFSDGEISALKKDKKKMPDISLDGKGVKKAEKNVVISIEVDTKNAFEFDQLSDRLLLEVINTLVAQYGKFSLRGLSKTIGISRSTLSGRLRQLVERELISFPELSKRVGIIEKEPEMS